MSPDLSKYLSLRSPLLYIGFALAISLGASSYAWFDHITAQGETAAGNVQYAGTRVDGWTAERVRSHAEERSEEVQSKEVAIHTPTGTLAVTVEDLGFRYDTDLAVERVLATRHRGDVIDQFVDWVRTLTTTKVVEEPVSFDPETARETLTGLERLVFDTPVSPGVELSDEWRLEVVPGVAGSAADIEDLLARVTDLDPLDNELSVDARAITIPPDFSDEEFQAVVDELNEQTRSGARLLIGGDIRQMSPAALRRHLSVAIEDGALVPHVDHAGLQEEIEEVFPEPIGTVVDPTFEVDGEEVTLVEPGLPADVCCAPGTAEKVMDAVLSGASGPFALTTRPQDDPTRQAWYDGSLVVEQVSSFTTPHNCCESRVTNIQRMADIVRGYYMVPGDVLSLNDYVGPRTREKGFVAAGAIRGGHLTPEVGGGVSQFATTIFNAAYFAGLDFIEYQAHSQYFSRYPFGREATISNPAPDLVFENTTEYPILIWTSYTSTSITVSMYSTKNVEAEQVATRTSSRNKCTYVETDRERTYSDGRTVIDTFFALYRPGDGLDCNGNVIPE